MEQTNKEQSVPAYKEDDAGSSNMSREEMLDYAFSSKESALEYLFRRKLPIGNIYRFLDGELNFAEAFECWIQDYRTVAYIEVVDFSKQYKKYDHGESGLEGKGS